MKKLARSKTNPKELTHDTIPATVGLVKEVRDELRADMRALDHKVESIRYEIQAVEHRLDFKIEKVVVAVHQTQILMEEQRGENRIVLDGIKNLVEKHERIEIDVGKLHSTIRLLKSSVV
jgi:hypothetical protein